MVHTYSDHCRFFFNQIVLTKMFTLWNKVGDLCLNFFLFFSFFFFFFKFCEFRYKVSESQGCEELRYSLILVLIIFL